MYKLEYDIAPSEEYNKNILSVCKAGELLARELDNAGLCCSIQPQVGAWDGIIEYSSHVVIWVHTEEEKHKATKLVKNYKKLWQQQAVGFTESIANYNFI